MEKLGHTLQLVGNAIIREEEALDREVKSIAAEATEYRMKIERYEEKISNITLELAKLFRDIKAVYSKSRVDVEEAKRLISDWYNVKNVRDKYNIMNELVKHQFENESLKTRLAALERLIEDLEGQIGNFTDDEIKKEMKYRFQQLNRKLLVHLKNYLNGISGMVEINKKEVAVLPS